MAKKYFPLLYALLLLVLSPGCKSKIKQQEDQLYSRHLQEHVKLTIITTPMPDDKSQLNLLLLNDGQDLQQLRVKEIIDSLYRKKLIQPLLIVGIHAGNRMEEYGVADYPDYKNNGSRADKYAAFIDDELYPYAKKEAAVRKFKTVVMAGCSLGGLLPLILPGMMRKELKKWGSSPVHSGGGIKMHLRRITVMIKTGS